MSISIVCVGVYGDRSGVQAYVFDASVSVGKRFCRDAGREQSFSTLDCLRGVRGRSNTQLHPLSTASRSMVKHGGGIADAWANPSLRSRPGEDLLLCKESEDADFNSGTGKTCKICMVAQSLNLEQALLLGKRYGSVRNPTLVVGLPGATTTYSGLT